MKNITRLRDKNNHLKIETTVFLVVMNIMMNDRQQFLM